MPKWGVPQSNIEFLISKNLFFMFLRSSGYLVLWCSDVPFKLCRSKSWWLLFVVQVSAGGNGFFKKVGTFCIHGDQNKTLVSHRFRVDAHHRSARHLCRMVLLRTWPSRIFDFFDLERYSASWICARKRLFKAIWAKFRKTHWNLQMLNNPTNKKNLGLSVFFLIRESV